MITYKEMARKLINGVGVLKQTFAMTPVPAGGQVATGALTANTRFTVAHGLGYPPLIAVVNARFFSLNDDTSTTPGLSVVAVDATNVTLKPSANVTAANVNFLLTIDLDVDDGGRNFAR